MYYVSVSVSMSMSGSGFGSGSGSRSGYVHVMGSPGAELKVAVSCLTRVLGIKPGSSERAANTLNY